MQKAESELLKRLTEPAESKSVTIKLSPTSVSIARRYAVGSSIKEAVELLIEAGDRRIREMEKSSASTEN